MDAILNWKSTKAMAEAIGMEAFVDLLETEYGYQFYGCSEAWMQNPKYVMQLKGAKGDLVIGWQGIHG